MTFEGLQRSEMSSFVTRSITGIVVVITITASVLASRYSFILLLYVIHLFALIEFYKLIAKGQFYPHVKEGLFLSTVLFGGMAPLLTHQADVRILFINVISVAVICISELYKNPSGSFQNLALTFFGLFYITLPVIFFECIAFLPFEEEAYQSKIILGYFILLWTSDSGAYAVGSLLGKHKLFERVSPKKTWEGSIGGGLLTLGVGYVISLWSITLTVYDWMVISLIIVVMGTYGDLFKSLLKRSANVKDSGNLLPGHGGFLDRFDSLIGSAPFVFGYLSVVKNGTI